MSTSMVVGIIKSDGLYTAGYNYYGGLLQNRGLYTGNANWQLQLVNRPEFAGQTIRQIVSSHYHTLVLLGNGKLYGAGYNHHGQLGVPTNYQTGNYNWTPLFIMDGVRQVDVGYYHSIVLKQNGEVYTFGYNAHGELGNGTQSNTWVHQLVATGANFVAAGAYHSVYVTSDGRMFTCGYNRYGQLARPQNAGSTADNRTFMEAQQGVRQVSCGEQHTLILKTDGKAFACGYNYHGQLGNSYNNWNSNPNWNPSFVTDGVRSVMAGGYHSLFLKNNGDLYGCGYDAYGQLGRGTTATVVNSIVLVRSNVRQVAAQYYSTHVLQTNGEVYAVGYNNYGNLGVSNNAGNGNANPNWLFVTNNTVRLYGNANIDIVLTGFTLTPTSHKEGVTASVYIDHIYSLDCQWRLFVNGVQKYPASGWTPLKATPQIATKSLPHTDFNLGENTVLIEVRDAESAITAISGITQKVNEKPTVPSATLSRTNVHKHSVTLNATLNDPDGDRVRYRIFLNNVQKYPSEGYTDLESVPVSAAWVFNNADMVIGLNTVKIEVVDDLGVKNEWTSQVIKVNTAPSVVGTVKGSFLNATIDDADGDKIQYRLLMNGVQIFPAHGYSNFLNVPFVIKYTIPKTVIDLDVENTLRIEVRDDLGGLSAREIKFPGVRSGLMFTDADESFYSTEFGEVLKYLDFGTIIAGQTTVAERVWVKNTLGYPVENIRLWVVQKDLDGVEAKAEISEFDSPFNPSESLQILQELGHNEKISFYVRITTTRQAKYGGTFDILVKADPVVR